VRQPRTTLEFIKYFCFENDGDLDELKENEPKRLSLYRLTASLLRAFADVADNLDELITPQNRWKRLGLKFAITKKLGMKSSWPAAIILTLKNTRADMRHLIDNYISAGESEKLSAFDDLTLIELIVERGVDFVEDLPEGIKKNKEAAAEVIENNVRRRIIEKSSTNPLYYEKMSELLMKIIEERKNQKAEYKEYLQKIVELTKKIEKPEEYSDYPERIKKSAALRALYDNVSKDEELLLTLHEKIMTVKPDKWLGDKAKEKAVLRGIHSVVYDEDKVDKTFSIVKEQREYW
jgi:type I restriction enzyme R subunit